MLGFVSSGYIFKEFTLIRLAKTRDITLVALFVVLTTVGGWIKIPMFPVPLTLQTFFVLLSGFVLGPVRGALTQALYLLLGLLGLPVFALGGGIGYLLQPTFGYLAGFIFAAGVTGWLFQQFRFTNDNWSIVRAVIFNFTGLLLIYLTGVLYLYFNLKYLAGKPVELANLAVTGFLIFLPADSIKIFLLIVLEKILAKNQMTFLRSGSSI